MTSAQRNKLQVQDPLVPGPDNDAAPSLSDPQPWMPTLNLAVSFLQDCQADFSCLACAAIQDHLACGFDVKIDWLFNVHRILHCCKTQDCTAFISARHR